MLKKLIVANWKLNPSTLKDAVKLASQIDLHGRNKAVLCPPSIFLSHIQYPHIGAQDCFWQDRGAFTGQTSPLQLKSLKVSHCIVGHSEKRAVGETDEQINAKVNALIRHKITPVLCVGYGTTAEEDDMAVVDVLRSQLAHDLKNSIAQKVVVAYEPVWAISSGNSIGHKTPTPEHAEKIALFIKTRFKVSKVLYGGSANVVNGKSFLQQRNIDGLLVGGDSLIPNHFNQIINY